MLLNMVTRILAKLKLTFYLRGSSCKLISKIWQLKSNSVVFDLGANVGVFTQLFSEIGCTVFAFEPHPGAFKELSNNCARKKNVFLFNVAVGDRSGDAPLFFHVNGNQDDLQFSQGTSLIDSKPNVDVNKAISCKVQSIASIVDMVDCIDFMKIDVEGAELAIINYLLSDPVRLMKIKFISCETQEKKWVNLLDETASIVSRVNRSNFSNKFDFSWR